MPDRPALTNLQSKDRFQVCAGPHILVNGQDEPSVFHPILISGMPGQGPNDIRPFV